MTSDLYNLILASRSQRRTLLLNEAGYRYIQVDPPYQDPPQPNNGDTPIDAGALAIELAMNKAHSAVNAQLINTKNRCIVIGCDTICVSTNGYLLGQPASRDDAKKMIQGFTNAEHDVVSGVALLLVENSRIVNTQTFHDTAAVRFGQLPDEKLEQYLNTDQWQGKAGGYNLFDRQQAGWDITVQGDPTTVVGLPMTKLAKCLADWSKEAANEL